MSEEYEWTAEEISRIQKHKDRWGPEVKARHEHQVSLLGKKVRVKLDVEVTVTGTFLGFGDGGDFEILEEDGFIHYCWPMLEIEEIKAG